MINSANDLFEKNRDALAGMLTQGSSLMIYLPETESAKLAAAAEALGAKPLSVSADMSYAQLKAAMDKHLPELYVGYPTALLSMLRACGKGSLRRALVADGACPDTVINEIEEILCTPLRSRLLVQEDEYSLDEGGKMAQLDKQLFSLGALVDCKVSAVKGGGYKLEAIYSGWMDPRQIIDTCPEVIAVKLREVSMDDTPMYKGKRRIE